MLCLPAADPHAEHLTARGLPPSASATVLHRGPLTLDWPELSSGDV